MIKSSADTVVTNFVFCMDTALGIIPIKASLTNIHIDNDNGNENMFIIIDLQISKIQNARYEYTEKNMEYYSFFDSIHGEGGLKPKLMSPNFCYTEVNISFLGYRKYKMVQNKRRITSLLLHLRSGVLLFHGQDIVQTSTHNQHWFRIQFHILRFIATKNQ